MKWTKLKQYDAGGARFNIEVGDDGTFRAIVDEAEVVKKNLDELQKFLSRSIKKKSTRISVELCALNLGRSGYGKRHDPSVDDCLLTGLHAANGNALVKIGNQKPEQISGWGHEHIWLKKMTADEKKRLLQLVEAANHAEDAKEKMIEELKIDLKEEAKKAYASAGFSVEKEDQD